jgi:uncharacterized protein YecE (DUF72 family)
MILHAGTSGFSYAAWKGSFYPADLRGKEMLAYYAARLSACEINGTFYRTPRPEVVRGWAREVPPGFSFVLKAPVAVGSLRYAAIDDVIRSFYAARDGLGDRAGPVLVQLAPHLDKDVGLLGAFLGKLPAGERIALEAAKPSWRDPDVLDLLARRGHAVAMTDDDAKATGVVAVGPWAYVRFRKPGYTKAALADFLAEVARAGVSELWAFFRHEDEGRGPRLARKLMAVARAGA